MILLPGTDKQIVYLLKNVDVSSLKILVVGSSSEKIAEELSLRSGLQVEVIVEDYDSFMNLRLVVKDEDKIKIRIMDFEHTDFNDNTFDLVYSQASISDFRRKGIIKEIQRILKPNGIFNVGEIMKMETELPPFINDVFDNADIDPILYTELENFYVKQGFLLMGSKNLTDTLKDYYSLTLANLEKSKKDMPKNELSYYKKLLNQIGHESKVYLKQGGEKYMGFKTLLLKNK